MTRVAVWRGCLYLSVIAAALVLATASTAIAQQDYCAIRCDTATPCGTVCYDSNKTTHPYDPPPPFPNSNCAEYGICELNSCASTCSGSSPCSQQCTINGFDATNCGTYGFCNGYPPPGGGGPSCSSCNVYSKCNQQCVGGPPNPYNHTCSEYTQCGQCAPPTTYTQQFWNDGSGNCYDPGVPFEGQSGGTCVFAGFYPYNNPPICSYNCTVECPNLQ